MLKTQITGAKYLSPQTNQMTNLNIAVPADSKDTKFGTSDILLAKDVIAYLNALDSDISKELTTQTDKIDKINESIKQFVDRNLIKIVTELPTTDIDKNCIYLVPNKDGEGNNIFIEYIYVEAENTFEEVGRIQTKVDLSDYYTKEETDNLILIAKNSAINIHNEDNSKSIKLGIDDPEDAGEYGSAVNVHLTDTDNGVTANINAAYGFTHTTDEGLISNLDSSGLYVDNGSYYANINANSITINDNNFINSIYISTNKELTEEEQNDEYSPVDLSLNDCDYTANINAKHGFTQTDGVYKANINAIDGFEHKTDDGFVAKLKGYALNIVDATGCNLYATNTDISLKNERNRRLIYICSYTDVNHLYIGSDSAFDISRPADNTEGATITGIKSLTAFANPSATKVWATDGSTVDLTTKADASDLDAKANASDVLLKKSASGGYYIESNSNRLGEKAFAANSTCAANGIYSFAEGYNTIVSGYNAHAEGYSTYAGGSYSHAEGAGTNAGGYAAHAEGQGTNAGGVYSHALGVYNIININAIHSVGIGDSYARKNAEYIYAKNKNQGTSLTDDPKNGYKYLIGVGGYDGISTDNSTYKSVQEVIADLTARIEQLETKVRALEAANTPA